MKRLLFLMMSLNLIMACNEAPKQKKIAAFGLSGARSAKYSGAIVFDLAKKLKANNEEYL